jgi:uncharacterized protein
MIIGHDDKSIRWVRVRYAPLSKFNPTNIKNQYVRDLHWLLTSSQMMRLECPIERSHADLAWLLALEREPLALEAHLANKNLRMLGSYFEALWEFYLSRYPGNQLLAKNLQVFSDNLTLGEFDFIYRDKKDGVVRHLEVAVKYYLGMPREKRQSVADQGSAAISPAESKQSDWLGPGSRDRLDKKYRKLTQRQALLSHTVAGNQVLKTLLSDQTKADAVKAETCLLGYLFYPLQAQIDPPHRAAENHLRGRWLYLWQLPELLQEQGQGQGQGLWHILNKPHWLAPIRLPQSTLLTHEQLSCEVRLRLAKRPHPLLLASFEVSDVGDDNNGGSQPIESQELIFVVPDDWPHGNNPASAR